MSDIFIFEYSQHSTVKRETCELSKSDEETSPDHEKNKDNYKDQDVHTYKNKRIKIIAEKYT